MDLFSFDLTEKFNFDEEYWSLTRILQYIIVSNNTFTNKIVRGASAIEELANRDYKMIQEMIASDLLERHKYYIK